MHERRPRVQAPQITRFAYKCALALEDASLGGDGADEAVVDVLA